MRDHNENYEPPERREHPEHPNEGTDVSFSPWGGDNLEPHDEQPCRPGEPEPELVTPEMLLMGDAFWGWSRVWTRL